MTSHSSVERAVAEFQAGRTAEAKGGLAARLALHPDDADAWLALGLIAIRSGGLAEGLAALRRVARLRPMLPESYRELAAAYRIADDDRARECTDSADALERDQAIASDGVAADVQQGATAEAIELGHGILARHPGAIRVRYELALAHQAHNDYPSVVECLRPVVAALPACAPAAKALGDFLWAIQKLERMTASFARTILGERDARGAPSSPGEVETHYRTAVRHDPEWDEARTYYANFLRDTGRLDDAIVHYRSAVDSAPRNAIARFNLAAALSAAGQAGAAVEHARRAVSVKPDFGEAHELLARLAFDAGDLAAALEHENQALGCARFHTSDAAL